VTWLLSFLVPRWLAIAKWAAVLLAVLSVLFAARRAGRDAERVDNLTRALEGARDARRIESRSRDLDRDALVERLREQRAAIKRR
jgi:hypothetical protein